METNGKKVYVVSDLHLMAGLMGNSIYDGTGNFLADSSFVRSLNHLQENLNAMKAGTMILNDKI
jgi:hypothetical protein